MGFSLFVFLKAYIIFFDQNWWQSSSCLLFNGKGQVTYSMSSIDWYCFPVSSYLAFWGWTDSSFHTSNPTVILPYMEGACGVSSFNQLEELRRHIYLQDLFIIVVCIFAICYFYSALDVFHSSCSDSFSSLFSFPYPSCTTG